MLYVPIKASGCLCFTIGALVVKEFLERSSRLGVRVDAAVERVRRLLAKSALCLRSCSIKPRLGRPNESAVLFTSAIDRNHCGNSNVEPVPQFCQKLVKLLQCLRLWLVFLLLRRQFADLRFLLLGPLVGWDRYELL